MGWMAHRKLEEVKQEPSMLPGPAVPGSCLISFHFLWAILCPQTVLSQPSYLPSLRNVRLPRERPALCDQGLPRGAGARAVDHHVRRPTDLHVHHLQAGRASAVQGWLEFILENWALISVTVMIDYYLPSYYCKHTVHGLRQYHTLSLSIRNLRNHI